VDPALLSGGIWQALLTTALGLGVAIPTVLAHGWLQQRVERCRHRLEAGSGVVVRTRHHHAPTHVAKLKLFAGTLCHRRASFCCRSKQLIAKPLCQRDAPFLMGW
jgi:hypothetical protein